MLEGLTALPFPVASQLCTRFVTQVSFRRSAESKEIVNVSIIPNPNAGDKYKKELAAFNRNIAPFSAEGFTALLDQVFLLICFFDHVSNIRKGCCLYGFDGF